MRQATSSGDRIGGGSARGIAAAAALVFALAAGGCRTVAGPPGSANVVVPRSDEAVIITVVGSETTLNWPTRAGLVYSVVYRDSLNAPWKTLPDCVNMPGTGGPMTIRIPTPPDNPNRRYNVRGATMKPARK